MSSRARGALVAALFLFAAPSPAQDQPLDKRVGKLESEMRAVQRKVFPGSDGRYFEPEIAPAATGAPPAGVPATSAVNDLTLRVDALERQMQTLTAQTEQNGFKLRQLEETLAKFRSDAEFRLTTLEGGSPAPRPGAAAAATEAPAPAAGAAPAPTADAAAAPPPPPVDPIEAEYRAAYAKVDAKQWRAAETELAAFVAKHPRHARASHAQYWLGRTFMAQNQPAQAARAFLQNYQTMPKGARAPDSLYWLGQALMKLDPPSPQKACEAYSELGAVYGAKLSASLKDQVAKARVAAKCS